MPLERRHVWVTGRVQGVCYRASCAEEAEHLGVQGWVRNLADGRVEAVFEGEPVTVEKMVNWCRVGPRGARVQEVRVTPEAPIHETAFRVLR